MKKTVLLCFPPLSPLGDQFYFRTRQLIDSLKNDFRVKIIHPLSRTGQGKDRKFSWKKTFVFLARIPQYLKKIKKTDIVLLFPSPLWYFWITAAKILNKKIIIDHFSTSLYPFEMRPGMLQLWKKFFLKLDQFFYPKIDLVITHSKTLKQEINSLYKIPKSKIIVVYSLVDNKIFDPRKTSLEKERKLKKHYQIPLKQKIILYHGKFLPFHGLPIIKKVANLSFRKKKNLAFVFIGRKEKNKQNMYFIDFLEFKKLPQNLALADLWIGRFSKNLRAKRTASSCMLQAMAMGIPVISHHNKENRNIIKNEENGFLIKSLEPKKIISKVEEILRDNKRLVKVGINARKTIKTHFSLKNWQKVNFVLKTI